jgi:hypothetical protein
MVEIKNPDSLKKSTDDELMQLKLQLELYKQQDSTK